MSDPFRDLSKTRRAADGRRAASAGREPFTPEQDAAADTFRARFVEVEKEIEKREADLAKDQDKLRGNPNDAALRAKVQAAKRPIIQLRDEHAELARAISRMLGGTAHTLPVE